jgi:hypothetical protein
MLAQRGLRPKAVLGCGVLSAPPKVPGPPLVAATHTAKKAIVSNAQQLQKSQYCESLGLRWALTQQF